MNDDSIQNPQQNARRRSFGPVALVLAALVGGASSAGVVLFVLRAGGDEASATKPADAQGQQAAHAEHKDRYHCPMHPSVVMDHQGTCPICGMKLVKIESAAGESSSAGPEGLAVVRIDPARQQLIGLRTAEVAHGTVGGSWRTVGRVAIDETRVRRVNVKVAGFVEKVFADFTGKRVRKGEPLFTLYSPELYSAQQEYLLALDTRTKLAQAGGFAQSGDELLASARRRLQLWDIPASEIERLERTHEVKKSLTIHSPISGVVVKKDVVEGMRLEAGAMPYEVVDLSEVWVFADVYESELRFLKLGMPATLALKAFPNQPFEGRVAFVDPLLDPTTRTVKVRLSFPNPSGDLRPEMFGEVTLRAPAREALRMPVDAVIDSGTKSFVFVSLGEGKFQPREVKLGDRDGSVVEVVEGLERGEKVVTRANFLVDSESRLKASLSAMNGSEPHSGHGGH